MTDHAALLPALEVETAAAPDAAVIWLHGLGADGNDFVPIVDELPLPAGLALRFVFPHAPVRPVTINNGFRMRAWYDIVAADFTARADLAGLRQSQRQLEALIGRERERGITAARIVVAGFSQGGAVAYMTALTHDEPLAGVIALSTYIPCGELVTRERTEANRDIAILAAHGRADDVVSPELGRRARDFLVRHGYRVDWHEYPMPHAVCLEEIRVLAEWLRQRLR